MTRSVQIYVCDHCKYESTVSAETHRPRMCPKTNCNGTQSPGWVMCPECHGMGTTTHDIIVGTEHDTEERDCTVCKTTGRVRSVE